MLRLLLLLLYIAPAVYCVTEVVQYPQDRPYGLRKWMWVLLIVLVPLLGAGVWLYLKWARGSDEPPTRSEPRAPDDDPEYLSWLRDQARRRRQRGEGDSPP